LSADGILIPPLRQALIVVRNLNASSNMNTFLKLNSKKIKFAYIVSVVSLLSFSAIVLLIAYFQGHHPFKELLAAILFTEIFVAPIINN
jgi:uncharacterized membrane protein (DUF485 family)